jgi:hypothetical protein
MAKAQIITPDGITIKVDGTADEIASLVSKFRNAVKVDARPARAVGKRRKSVQKLQLVDLVDSLMDGGFFRTPRDLAAVRSALAQMGHHYPITTLSGAMLRKVRKQELRRLKQDKRWMYTGSNI